MAAILVVCSGNICRSPIAEGLLRRALERRLDDGAPAVGSAGTIAVDGAPAMPESVEAARERGVDIRTHGARRLTPQLIDDADLVVGMAAEHREAVARLLPGAAARAFTLKELTRILEARTTAETEPRLDARVGAAAAARANGAPANRFDEDVVDPLGMPLETYRAIAWELDE
ncbi:MAG: low molecular weight phosphatase family protein, partial [Acidobacteria bacterium]|nr:low molecular weight phosphatase family protein [Acidobacteriota bacterium]